NACFSLPVGLHWLTPFTSIFVCHCAIPSAHRTLAPLAVGAVGCLCFHILSIFFPSSVNNFSLDFYEF
ncbi:hypothetical protein F5051DRAFT_419106, partial [Lentinula edodes]